jgi:hypothetical protein
MYLKQNLKKSEGKTPLEGVRGNLYFFAASFWQTQSRPSEFSANLNQVVLDVTSLMFLV